MISRKPDNIDEYIAGFPEPTQQALQLVRATIRKLAPEAVESVSYGIAAFHLNNTYLVYFGGYKTHIGMYPAPVSIEAFKEDIAHYKSGKGSVQFPLNAPMPLDLIEKIVKFRISQSTEKVRKTAQ
jgi:uncharacterized protein YdhG (YjbR/CyaY superfamily)